MISQPMSEIWNFLSTPVFSILILVHCSRCHMSVVDVNGSVSIEPSNVHPHTVQSPTSFTSINCASQDPRWTKPITVAGVTQSASSTRRVVVFDIDYTLCHSQDKRDRKTHPYYALNFTECPHIWFTWRDERYLHVFLPHLQILFNYLMQHDVRIAFFSSDRKERNLCVITELLTSLWGRKKYEALKQRGQFQIHSKDDMREGDDSVREYGKYVKDLRRIIQDGESLANAVLVEDDSAFRAHDQGLVILVGRFNIFLWYQRYNFLNNVYYLMGLFETYFENEKYQALPLREAMTQILPLDPEQYRDLRDAYGVPFVGHFPERHPFVREMIDLGFAAVLKEVPHAILYEYEFVRNSG